MSTDVIQSSEIIREFNAQRQLVFDAWTKVKHLNNWMFPFAGCTCEFLSANIVDGGDSHHKITMPDGSEMWLYTKYEKVLPPEKLVFLQYFSNQSGDIIPMPNIPNWPKDMLATLYLKSCLMIEPN